jgi:hypothetical protein
MKIIHDDSALRKSKTETNCKISLEIFAAFRKSLLGVSVLFCEKKKIAERQGKRDKPIFRI